MLKAGEAMKRKTLGTAYAVGRSRIRRMINEFLLFGRTVRPWKRALVLLLLLPVVSLMTGYEYLENNRGPAKQEVKS